MARDGGTETDMSDLVVLAEGLRTRFGKTQALDGVDLAMRRAGTEFQAMHAGRPAEVRPPWAGAFDTAAARSTLTIIRILPCRTTCRPPSSGNGGTP